MYRIMFRHIIIFIILTLYPLLSQGESVEHDLLKVIDSHCVKCHGRDGKIKGKTDLFSIKDLDGLTKNPELIQTLIEVLSLIHI